MSHDCCHSGPLKNTVKYFLYISVCTYVVMYVYVYVCVCVCVCIYIYIYIYIYMGVCVCEWISHTHVCCINIYIYIYIYIKIYIYIYHYLHRGRPHFSKLRMPPLRGHPVQCLPGTEDPRTSLWLFCRFRGDGSPLWFRRKNPLLSAIMYACMCLWVFQTCLWLFCRFRRLEPFATCVHACMYVCVCECPWLLCRFRATGVVSQRAFCYLCICHVWSCVYVRVCIQLCVRVCIHAYTHTCKHTCKHTRDNEPSLHDMHACMYIRFFLRILETTNAYMHTRAHVRAWTG
jgi:hypothetical protein